LPTGMQVVADSAPRRVPSVAVPCFDGSGEVRLDGIARPTVINLWASWCQPCQAEMPGVAAFATAARSTIDVIGVDTADTRTGGRSMISEFDLSFPLLFDEDKRFANAIGDTALPATLFVAPGGQIRAIYTGDALDATSLRAWTAQYLGVRVG
jgi:thiol-disulfide isomerase/thioredoxin